ncbi:MAG: SMC-Scp complex subunit ScpB [Myxococcota bacterium]
MSDNGIIAFPGRDGGVDQEVVAAVEACLFASGDPVKVRVLAEAVRQPTSVVRAVLAHLAQRNQAGGIVLERIGEGWRYRTAERFASTIQRLTGTRPTKLSQAALEVLAVIAYRQPVTRPAIEALRGVDSGGVLKTLLDRGLVRSAGRAEDPGRPLLYRTTTRFLETFGLANLKALPTLSERASLVRTQDDEAIVDGDEVELEPAIVGGEE